TSAQETPRSARSRAIPAPLMPPPTTSTETRSLRSTPAGLLLAFLRGGRSDAQRQLDELLRVDGRGRTHQQVLPALRLREGDHVAQALGTGQQHRHAVEAEGEAAVRR